MNILYNKAVFRILSQVTLIWQRPVQTMIGFYGKMSTNEIECISRGGLFLL